MALNVVLLSQITGYVIITILTLCVNTPMICNLSEFNDHCLLFSSGKWNATNGQFQVNWSSKINCTYPIILNFLILSLSLYQIYKYSVYLYRGRDSSFLSAFCDIVLSIVFTLLTIIAACMITFGFIQWCQAMIERFPSCEISEGSQIDILDNINTKNFYLEMGTAQFAIWAMFATWVALSICALWKMWKYHQLDIIRSSMYNERRKLAQQESSNERSSSLVIDSIE